MCEQCGTTGLKTGIQYNLVNGWRGVDGMKGCG